MYFLFIPPVVSFVAIFAITLRSELANSPTNL
jgi:hypothetical protein